MSYIKLISEVVLPKPPCEVLLPKPSSSARFHSLNQLVRFHSLNHHLVRGSTPKDIFDIPHSLGLIEPGDLSPHK